MSGDRLPAQPRSVIGQSWQRMHNLGVDPDSGNAPDLLSTDELERRRGASGLAAALPVLRGALAGVADAAAHIMVVVDVEGRVLWRDGSDWVRRRAENLGFTEGACWHENVVGTNAIGTSLVERRHIQVYSAELAEHVFGDPTRTVTARAEMSRLRRQLGTILAHRPYRFADHIDVTVLESS